jgi:hypothetical protein
MEEGGSEHSRSIMLPHPCFFPFSFLPIGFRREVTVRNLGVEMA